MENKKTEYAFKRYEELVFSDDFMFGRVMQDERLCHDVLECLLQEPVGKLLEITAQRIFSYTKKGKPVRFDIYAGDDKRVYDSEIQNLNKQTVESLCLEKRSRFYQSSIDTDHMNKKGLYKKLPDSVIMFICTFDPMGKGLARYTFRERCEEDDRIYLNDGTEKIFYNCTYTGKDIPGDLKKLYEYITTGKVSDNLTKRIDSKVKEVRKREEWRSEYMKEMVLLMDAKEEGREEGREEERKNTEKERQRADSEGRRADKAEARVRELEALLVAK